MLVFSFHTIDQEGIAFQTFSSCLPLIDHVFFPASTLTCWSLSSGTIACSSGIPRFFQHHIVIANANCVGRVEKKARRGGMAECVL